MLDEHLRQLNVLVLFVCADVVDLPRLPLPEHDLDRRAMVVDVEPVPDLAPVSVERQWFAVEGVRHEERQKLLLIMVGPVGVQASRDRSVDSESPHSLELPEVSAPLR